MRIFKYKKSISALLVAAMTGVVLFSSGSAFGVNTPQYSPSENAGLFPKLNGLYIGDNPSPELAAAIAEAFAGGFHGLYVDGPVQIQGKLIANAEVEINGKTDIDGELTIDSGNVDVKKDLTVEGSVKTNDIQSAVPGGDIVIDSGDGDVVVSNDLVLKSMFPDAKSDGYATLKIENKPNEGLLAFAYRNINAYASGVNPANALYLNDLSKGPVNIGGDLVVNNDILVGGEFKDLNGNVIVNAGGGKPFDGTLNGDLHVYGNAFVHAVKGGVGGAVTIDGVLKVGGQLQVTDVIVNPETAVVNVGSELSVSGGVDTPEITNGVKGKTNGRLKIYDPDGILITNSIANNTSNNGSWVKINDDQGLKISNDLDVDGEAIIRSAAIVGANGSAPFKIDSGGGEWISFSSNSITTYGGPLHLNAMGSDEDVMIGFPLSGGERSNLIVFGDTDVDGLLTASQIGKFTVKSTGKIQLPSTSVLNDTTLGYSVSCPADYWVVSCGVDYTSTNIIPSGTTNTSSACAYFFNKNGNIYTYGTVLNVWVTLSQTCWKTETDKFYSDSEDYF